MGATIGITTPVVLAHQGGWDEALLIGGPILAIVGLLWLAKRRVDAAASATSGTGGNPAAPIDRD
jgi:hypothetical protein